jgi:hypothetical protein
MMISKGETKYSEKNLNQRHFIHQISDADCTLASGDAKLVPDNLSYSTG